VKAIKVSHLITDLDSGGAEIMLQRLLARMDGKEFASRVVSLTGDGPVGERLRAQGIPVGSLGMQPDKPDWRLVRRLAADLRREKPDLLQTWMYHADLVGGMAAALAKVPVVWGLHNSTLDPHLSKARTRFVVRCLALLSHVLPARIISCSAAAAAQHIKLGYNPKRMVVIPNGFDTAEFHPDADLRKQVLREINIPQEALLAGCFARFDPQKDHRTLLAAAGQIAVQLSHFQLLLCGEGITVDNSILMDWIKEFGLETKVHLLGRRDDIPRLMAALDIYVSSSAYGEAFPLVLGEAMSCGIVCAATAVGDSAEMIVETGRVVPPGQAELLSAACLELLSLPPVTRIKMGLLARQRVQERYDLGAVTERYAAVYRSIVSGEKG
jgi:glycosyltransferase involved in cell wall biosynthesis